MLDFMDYVQRAFFAASKWNRDNAYSSLNSTAEAILDFPTPRGVNVTVSSLPTAHFAASYTGALAGPVNGSLSYLYSSIPLVIPSSSASTPLYSLVRGYKHLINPPEPEDARYWETWHQGRRVDQKANLMYARLFLPTTRLEGLFLRRSSPSRLIQIRGVSDGNLPNGGSLLGIIHNDYGKYCLDTLFSTDSALLGIRGLYHFEPIRSDDTTTSDPIGLFSTGAELYYGLLNKSGGLSTAVRFTTLPAYHSFPYTMTLTLNPLMGNFSSTYAVKAGRYLSLCGRFDFNIYSYESGVILGFELWRLGQKPSNSLLQTAEKMANHLDIPPSAVSIDDLTINPGIEQAAEKFRSKPGGNLASIDYGTDPMAPSDDKVAGVLKARVDQDGKFGLVWEGRMKEMLLTVGGSLDLKRRKQIFSGFGIELQYSS